jgi:GNAT superfamily N-acetyltransferase
MKIKKAGKEDIGIIQMLAEIIWPEAYKKIISAAQLRYMLDLIYSETALTAQIEKGHQFILAIENNEAIGFASFSQKNDEEPTTFRLHKIYVLPNVSTKGIGSFLLSYVCNESKKQGATLLELNVNKYNTAMQFYLKKGFTVLRDEVIDIGGGYVMDDYVRVLAL